MTRVQRAEGTHSTRPFDAVSDEKSLNVSIFAANEK